MPKDLDEAIHRALAIGPISTIRDRLKYELRDLAAHRTMVLGENATAKDLFDDLFGDIPAQKEK